MVVFIGNRRIISYEFGDPISSLIPVNQDNNEDIFWPENRNGHPREILFEESTE